ncbi:type II toxin-antitoxin system VapC family toxin [soil metagenome]
MSFQLDTSIAIPIRDGDIGVLEKLERLTGAVAISVIARVELEGGLHGDDPERSLRQSRLDAMLAVISVLPFDGRCAAGYRAIVESTGFSRRKVSDRMIAAQAIVAGATLITANAADFQDIPGLDRLVW